MKKPDFHKEWMSQAVRVKSGPWAGVEAMVSATHGGDQRVELAWPGNDEKNTVIRLWFNVSDLEKVPEPKKTRGLG